MPKTMTVSQVMKQLEEQGDEKVRQRYVRDGAGDNVFGVLLGKLRGLAEVLGTNHALGRRAPGRGPRLRRGRADIARQAPGHPFCPRGRSLDEAPLYSPGGGWGRGASARRGASLPWAMKGAQ
ncbi:hypothetical protein ACN28I_11055 [Archangium gephyra]|uniref:hypothetical protein n=1 Tax=Archangium gephyra TaxID=48 RepID=UPI003B80362F